jgi:cystathionine beta-lyase/cystathionine gamma-synthase
MSNLPLVVPSHVSNSISTQALHPPALTRTPGQPLVGSLCQSTSFQQAGVGHAVPYAYSRVSNPTVSELEAVLGALEDAPPAVTFATGLAAETALLLSVLRTGDHVVAGAAIYGGTVRLLQQILAPLGITHTFVDSTQPALVAAAIQPNTRLVFIETPANPTLVLTDIAAIAAVCRPRGVLLAVDNTFLTPAIQRPLDLGADLSVYSTTKHMEGHSTALGGALVSRNAELLDRTRFIRKSTGAIQTPFNAWLTTRGLKTLQLRLRQQSAHAQVVAEWLSSHPAVATVNYPGLHNFPQRDLARAQHGNIHGGVLSVELSGGVPAALEVLQRLKLITLAEHVGSVESLVTHSATMTHADVPADQRRAAGISDGLLRISVGLEEPADLVADLEHALAPCSTRTAATPVSPSNLVSNLVQQGGVQ